MQDNNSTTSDQTNTAPVEAEKPAKDVPAPKKLTAKEKYPHRMRRKRIIYGSIVGGVLLVSLIIVLGFLFGWFGGKAIVGGNKDHNDKKGSDKVNIAFGDKELSVYAGYKDTIKSGIEGGLRWYYYDENMNKYIISKDNVESFLKDNFDNIKESEYMEDLIMLDVDDGNVYLRGILSDKGVSFENRYLDYLHVAMNKEAKVKVEGKEATFQITTPKEFVDAFGTPRCQRDGYDPSSADSTSGQYLAYFYDIGNLELKAVFKKSENVLLDLYVAAYNVPTLQCEEYK